MENFCSNCIPIAHDERLIHSINMGFEVSKQELAFSPHFYVQHFAMRKNEHATCDLDLQYEGRLLQIAIAAICSYFGILQLMPQVVHGVFQKWLMQSLLWHSLNVVA